MNHGWRRTSLTLILLLASAQAVADERPRWSFELKGGTFHSAIDDWGDFYDDDRMTHYGLGFAYKLLRQFEVGVEAGYRSDRGRGFAPGHGAVAGNVRYQLLPMHVTATLRAVFYEDQWLVPYVGAATGRYSYRVTIEGQDRQSGGTDGTLYRAGVQLLLDRLDRRAAFNMRRHYGIDNTYLFFEARESEAEIDGSDLGGTAYLGGLLFEF
jgi:hypothetical protein